MKSLENDNFRESSKISTDQPASATKVMLGMRRLILVLLLLLLLLLLSSTTDAFSTTTPSSTTEVLFRYRARVAYDGKGFQGFQIQSAHKRTVQGDLELVLKKRFDTNNIRVVGASRTDAGVHARGQAVHFDLKYVLNDQELERLEVSLNRMLPPDVRIFKIQYVPYLVKKTIKGKEVELPWNAIYDSVGKLYIYRLSSSNSMDPLERHQRYDMKWLNCGIDMDVLKQCVKEYEGEHDFRCFAGGIERLEREGFGKFNTVRTVYSVTLIEEDSDMYRIEFHIQGALYKMVRNMVGTAVNVATGQNVSWEQFLEMLHHPPDAGRRTNLSKPAPPEGLTLEEVYYDDY